MDQRRGDPRVFERDARGREDGILLVLHRGEDPPKQTAFPIALSGSSLAADLRAMNPKSPEPKFKALLLRLLAGMLGHDFTELLARQERYEKSRRYRLRFLGATAAILMLGIASFGVHQYLTAAANELAQRSANMYRLDSTAALQLAAKAVHTYETQSAYSALFHAYNGGLHYHRLKAFSDQVSAAAISHDGRFIAAASTFAGPEEKPVSWRALRINV